LAAAFARVQFNYLLRWLVDGNTVVVEKGKSNSPPPQPPAVNTASAARSL
jgi:hypothetical protein